MAGTYVAPNPDKEAAFWDFVAARQEAWYRRFVLRLPQEEWAEDPVIKVARFTNVYRELDRGTQFGVEEVLEADRPPHLALAHSITYRMFNRIETYFDLSALVDDAYVGDELAFQCMSQLLDERLERKEKVFTGAYMCVSTPDFGYPTRGGNYAHMLLQFYDCLSNRVYPVLASPLGTLRNIYDAFDAVPGVGAFMAYQLCLDLMYPLRRLSGGKVAMFADPDSWTKAGPGCIRGLEILGVKGPDNTLVRAMRSLHAKHVDELHPRGFKWLRDDRGSTRALSLANIENCFCEFSKWCRMAEGGHVKTKWSPRKPGEWEPRCLTLPYYGGWLEPETGRYIECRE